MFDWALLKNVDFFNKERTAFFIEELKASLKKIAGDFGIEISCRVSKAKFKNLGWEGNIEVSVVITLSDGYKLPLNKEALNFLQYCRFFDLEKSALGQKMLFKGKEMRLLGFAWNGKKTKFCVAYCSTNGKTYKVPLPLVKGLLPI